MDDGWTPSKEDLERLDDLKRLMREREPVHMDSRDYELMLAMRDRMGRLEDAVNRFREEPQIRAIAREEATAVMKTAGFDMDHLNETNNQVQWLLSLKRGFKGFALAVVAAITTLATTLAASYISSKWGSK